MNDAEFLIRVKSVLEGNGIKLSEEQTKSLTEELRKTSRAADEFGQAGKDAAEKVGLSHRELRESVGAVGRAFGGLADVGLWLSPVTAALAAVLMAVDWLKEHFAALNEKIREYIEVSRQIRSDHMDAMAAATRETADAMGEYARQARAAAEAQDDQNTAMQNRMALNDAYIEGLKKIEEAEEKAYETQLERDVEEHRITEEEAQRRKDIARERLAADTANLTAQQEHLRIDEKKHQFDEAYQRIPQEQAARDAALRAAEHPTVTAADTQKEIERQSKILKEQNKKVADSLSEADQHRTAGTTTRLVDDFADHVAGKPSGTLAAASAKLAERQAAEDQKLADATAVYIRKLQEKQDASDQTVKNTKAEADVQNKKLEKDQELVRTLPDQITHAEALASIHENTAEGTLHWQGVADETGEATGRARQRRRVAAGQGSAADIREQGDYDTVHAASREPGAQAAIDASRAVADARVIDAHLRGRRSQDVSREKMDQVHEVHQRIIGFLENHVSSQVTSQHGILSDLDRRLSQLESQFAMNRGNPP